MIDFTPDDERFMDEALALAMRAGELGEVPVGAVVVEDGKIIGRGHNSPISSADCSAHAEINALREACHQRDNYRIPETTLYVTLEPCAMCAGAIVHSRVARVIVATTEPRAGAAGSVMNILQHPKLNHRCEVAFGLKQDDSSKMLKAFFKARR